MMTALTDQSRGGESQTRHVDYTGGAAPRTGLLPLNGAGAIWRPISRRPRPGVFWRTVTGLASIDELGGNSVPEHEGCSQRVSADTLRAMASLERFALAPDLTICRMLNGMWQASGAHGRIEREKAKPSTCFSSRSCSRR